MIPASGPEVTNNPMALPLNLNLRVAPGIEVSSTSSFTNPSLVAALSSGFQLFVILQPFPVLTFRTGSK